jgi:hypothetical protein
MLQQTLCGHHKHNNKTGKESDLHIFSVEMWRKGEANLWHTSRQRGHETKHYAD